MAATPPSNSNPSGENRKAAGETPVPLTFEDKLHQFWQTNRMVVLGLCAVVLVAILGKGIWERVQRQRELDVEAAYAAANTPEQLRAFAGANPNHELAGVAEIRIADEAYAAGKAADAVTAYDKALAVLKDGPLASRAKLGRALAKTQAGNATEGEAELKLIATDSAQFKEVRSEAAYDLANLAADAGNSDDVMKNIQLLNQIDPASLWARRAVALQAKLPQTAKPTVGLPATSAAPAAGPNVQIKLPTK